MTKAELLVILEQYKDEDIFLLSSDDEGNSIEEASLGAPEKAFFDGDEWTVMHPEDIEAGEYDDYGIEDDDIKTVGVFW